MRSPLTESGMRAALYVAPIVFLLVWIFNSCKLGLHKDPQYRRKLIWGSIAVIIALAVSAIIFGV